MNTRLVLSGALLLAGANAFAATPNSPAPELSEAPTGAQRVETVIIVSESEIADIFEDMTGYKPSSRRLRYYTDWARSRRLDRAAFVEEFRHGQECTSFRPDEFVEQAFRHLLGRSPTRHELHSYTSKLEFGGWTAGQVTRDLRASTEYREREADRIISRAYEELLERSPDPDGLRYYRRKILRDGYTDEDVRRKLRETKEYRFDLPNEKITRAFVRVLGREPDLGPSCDPFRRLVLDRGYTEEDLVQHLRRSDEFKERTKELVRRAFLDLLGREPDPQGLEHYRRALLERGWSEEQMRESIRRSPEFRDRTKKN